MALEITPSLVIDDSELEERFVRASGPGGQNVNKVSTAVQLRYDVGRSTLHGEVRARLRVLAGSRMTDEDVLLIDARAHRTQAQNREDARARLVESDPPRAGPPQAAAEDPPRRRRQAAPPGHRRRSAHKPSAAAANSAATTRGQVCDWLQAGSGLRLLISGADPS